jgi:DNA repair exonuclease SbcCD ATPase subunit
MGTAFENYYDKRQSDAEDFVDQYWDELMTELKDGGRFDSYDFIDGESRLHEFVDQYISPREAIDILDNADETETDSGLWEGIENPLDAVSAMGFWTYKLDLYNKIKEVMKEKLEEQLEKEKLKQSNFENELSQLQNRLEHYQELVEELQEKEELSEHEENSVELYEKQIEQLDADIEEAEETYSDQENLIDSIENAIDDL